MKTSLMLTLAVFAAGTVLADDSPKDQVLAAATALDNEPNYSWHTTSSTAGGGFRRGPSDGKTEKGGYLSLTMTFNDNTVQLLTHGTNAAVKTEDGWQSAAEAAQGDGNGGFSPAMMMARLASVYRTPAADVTSLVGQTQDLTAGTNGITGDLTEEGAKGLLTFRRATNGNGPTASNAKGSVTFWLADGKLVKFQTHVTGTVSFNGNDRDVDRTSTTEVKDVGTTKIEVPDDAKKKME